MTPIDARGVGVTAPAASSQHENDSLLPNNTATAVETASLEALDEESISMVEKEGADDNNGSNNIGKNDTMYSDDEDEYATLSDDIYSLFYTTKRASHVFMFSIFVFLFQCSIILLISVDLIDLNNKENPLQIPAYVPLEVTIAQGFAVVLAVATQSDLFSAIISFHDGYDKRAKQVDPDCTFTKWFFSCLGQFCVGIWLLVVIFILIVQSTNVIGMMLNFAALSFVSEIDNVAFKLGKFGFFSNLVQRECHNVTNYKFPIQSKRKSNLFRRIIFLLIIAGLLGGWGYIVHLQRWAKFLPASIFVQFGDEYDPNLAFFSGVYEYDKAQYIDRRLVYVERRSNEAYFAYCKEEEAWTFSASRSFGPCGEWNATSRDVDADISSSVSSGWHVHHVDGTGIMLSKQFDFFFMTDSDCHGIADCNNVGQCVNNRCECKDGRIGRQCEFGAPCSSLSVDERTLPFPNDEPGLTQVSSNFTLLMASGDEDQPVLVYDKPVYVFDYGSGIIDVVMFLGRRWIVTNTITFGEAARNISSTSDLAAYLSDDFHGYFDTYGSYFVSASMDVDTPSDAASPVGLQWFRVKQSNEEAEKANEVDYSQLLNTNLLCAVCIPGINECSNLGVCERFSCTCLDGFYGDLCEENLSCSEFGCYSNGVCDEVTGICTCTEGFAGNLCHVNTTERLL